jgi:GLPGLI family protein
MKYILTFTVICLLAGPISLSAQHTRFITEGVIEFNKSVNMHALLKKIIAKDKSTFMQQIAEQYIRTQPQFKVMKSTLSFSKDKTLFKPVEEAASSTMFFTQGVNQNNTIFNDLSTGMSISQKKVFEETFLVSDSTRKIKWKITDETRNIAGYDCRRANALVMDSIYVVAFYTDDIVPSGGPESFSGLPGMILGVALPHENTTWFASSVSDRPVPPNALVPPKKGKAATHKSLRETLLSVMKNWGSSAQTILKDFML